jgi:hypothetical protein
MLAATLKPIRLECYLPRLSDANKLNLFRADSLARYLLQCAYNSTVVGMDKMVVGLNVATRSCNVCPDKCWFAVLCRFWFQCSRTLRRKLQESKCSLHRKSTQAGGKFELVWNCAVTEHISAVCVTTELYGGNRKV